MTATQFYIWIVVLPVTTVITVLIGVLLNNNNMNHRFSVMAGRFETHCERKSPRTTPRCSENSPNWMAA